MTTGASLAGPLALALARYDYPGTNGPSNSHENRAEFAVAELRRSPEVLAAMAEALHAAGGLCAMNYPDKYPDEDRREHEFSAAAILDTLLGAGSAAEGAEK